MKQVLQNLLNLTLDMGHVIRAGDEEGSHSEVWTNDGEYVPDPRFEAAQKALASRVWELACYTTGDDAGLPTKAFLQLVVDRIQDDLRDGTYDSGPNSNNPETPR